MELLAAGWSTRSINQMLGRMFPDYEPVPKNTLNDYRRQRIRADMMRPLEEYQRRLRDEHVLMDPVRERAALIVLQEARVQRALDLEEKLEGVVLPSVGQEIDRLANLWDRYEQALGRIGMVRGPDGHVTVNAPAVQQQVNVYEILTEQVAVRDPVDREQLAGALDRVRQAQARARLQEVEARVRTSLPPGYPGNGREPEEGG